MSLRSYRFGPFRLDPRRLLLMLGDEPLALGPKVVETLLAFAERPDELLTKSELLDRVWPEGFVEEANLAQNIYVIRKVLRAHWNFDPILTVPRRGYRFVAPVAVAAMPLPAAPAAPSRLRPSFGSAAAAVALAGAVALGIMGVRAQPHPTPSGNLHALSSRGARYYAIGRYYWNQRTAIGFEKSLRYFARVMATDPRDARGYAALAEAYALLGDYNYGRLSMKASYARARWYAGRALRIDPRLAEAHAAMGIAQDMPGTRARARAEYRRAIALDPSYAPAHQWYGISLLEQGHVKAAFDELERAASLDPISVAANAWLSEAAYFSRRYSEAIALARQTLDLSPQRRDVYVPMGLAFEASGDYRDAVDAFKRYGHGCMMCKGESAALLAHAFALAHDREDAGLQLQRAQRAKPTAQPEPRDVAIAMLAMGRRTEALHLLSGAWRKKLDPMLAVDPRMDIVRGDRRFQAYLRKPA